MGTDDDDPVTPPAEVEAGDEPFIIVDDEAEDDDLDPSADASAEDELDGMRIRHLVHLRRANIRSQTYGIVGLIVCAVAAVKLVLMAYHRYSIEQWSYCGGFAASGLGCVIGALIFAGHVDRLRAELHRPSPSLLHEPDFELLSDGSHHVKNLEEMSQ